MGECGGGDLAMGSIVRNVGCIMKNCTCVRNCA
jgi:hypothetical protein